MGFREKLDATESLLLVEVLDAAAVEGLVDDGLREQESLKGSSLAKLKSFWFRER